MEPEIQVLPEGFVYAAKTIDLSRYGQDDDYVQSVLRLEFEQLKGFVAKSYGVEHYLERVSKYPGRSLLWFRIAVFGSYLDPHSCPMGRTLFHAAEGLPADANYLKFSALKGRKDQPIGNAAAQLKPLLTRTLMFERQLFYAAETDQDGRHRINTSQDYWKRIA